MGDRWYDAQLGRWISADTIVPDYANPQSLNRCSYVYDNPLKYTDSSGHTPIPSPMIDGLVSAGGNYTRAGGATKRDPSVWQRHKGPGIPVSPERKQQAKNSKTLALTCDGLALTTSVVGAMVEWGAIAVALSDGPEAGPSDGVALVAEVAVLKVYAGYINKVEDGFGLASLSLTASGDLLGGYTYLDTDTESRLPELVVGEDTYQDVLLMIPGEGINLGSHVLGFWFPEAMLDSVVNWVQFKRDIDYWNQEPTSELRITVGGDGYIKRYGDDE